MAEEHRIPRGKPSRTTRTTLPCACIETLQPRSSTCWEDTRDFFVLIPNHIVSMQRFPIPAFEYSYLGVTYYIGVADVRPPRELMGSTPMRKGSFTWEIDWVPTRPGSPRTPGPIDTSSLTSLTVMSFRSNSPIFNRKLFAEFNRKERKQQRSFDSVLGFSLLMQFNEENSILSHFA